MGFCVGKLLFILNLFHCGGCGDAFPMQTITTFRASPSQPAFLDRVKALFVASRRVASVSGEHSLRPGQVERITVDGPGEIFCPAGRVWITRDGGGPDIVLDAGESHRFSRRGSFLVEALLSSAITLAAPPSYRR